MIDRGPEAVSVSCCDGHWTAGLAADMTAGPLHVRRRPLFGPAANRPDGTDRLPPNTFLRRKGHWEMPWGAERHIGGYAEYTHETRREYFELERV